MILLSGTRYDGLTISKTFLVCRRKFGDGKMYISLFWFGMAFDGGFGYIAKEGLHGWVGTMEVKQKPFRETVHSGCLRCNLSRPVARVILSYEHSLALLPMFTLLNVADEPRTEKGGSPENGHVGIRVER